jgi:hypothetical protein
LILQPDATSKRAIAKKSIATMMILAATLSSILVLGLITELLSVVVLSVQKSMLVGEAA